ncbi:MAG: CDP-diacylglycerol--glycerol-3-phosphate 3-phosphatidyltransferase [Planctomycetes bacterium]|nr:CDP-diacylglycerol--glycerol-3-phosphate 3-phosphatidyltransferase [Planctomycetota bacterium]
MGVNFGKADIPGKMSGHGGGGNFNLPNKLTFSRLILSVAFFVLLTSGLYDIALVIFSLAAITDWFDGYYARKWGQSTDLGRIADPFVDKVIICGGFIIMIPLAGKIVAPWMVIVIVMREFLVSSIRGYSESRGVPFASNIWGKTKMFCQSITILALTLYLGHFSSIVWAAYVVYVCVWITIIVTLFSAIFYIISGRKVLLGP